MKKTVAILLLILCLGTLGAQAKFGIDKDIGSLSDPVQGSVEEKLSSAFLKAYDLAWVEGYVAAKDQHVFSMQYSKSLSSLLPFDGFIYSKKGEECFMLKCREKRTIVTVFHSSGLITSLGISSY